MQVKDVMTARVIRVCGEARVADALRLMMEHQVDGLPVVDDTNAVVGIVTYADILRRARRQHVQAVDFLLTAFVYYEEDDEVNERIRRLFQMPVAQIGTKDVITCSPEDHVADVAGLMVDHRIKRVPVVSEHGVLVGVISRSDVMRAIWNAQAEQDHP